MRKKKAVPVEDPFDTLGWRLGGIVRKHRLKAGLTLRELSELTGVHPSTIHWTEYGERKRALTVERFCYLSMGLGREFAKEVVTVILEHSRLKGART